MILVRKGRQTLLKRTQRKKCGETLHEMAIEVFNEDTTMLAEYGPKLEVKEQAAVVEVNACENSQILN